MISSRIYKELLIASGFAAFLAIFLVIVSANAGGGIALLVSAVLALTAVGINTLAKSNKLKKE